MDYLCRALHKIQIVPHSVPFQNCHHTYPTSKSFSIFQFSIKESFLSKSLTSQVTCQCGTNTTSVDLFLKSALLPRAVEKQTNILGCSLCTLSGTVVKYLSISFHSCTEEWCLCAPEQAGLPITQSLEIQSKILKHQNILSQSWNCVFLTRISNEILINET